MRTDASLPLPLLLASALLVVACDEPGKPGAAGGASSAKGAPAGPGGAPSGRATAAPPKIADTPAYAVELQKFVLTSAVKSKEPSDLLDAAKPGQRVYGHLTVRNRTDGPKRVSLSFRINGDERTLVDLTIEKSWSWRTWGYVTLRKEDKGELTVHVFDDHGAELGTQSIPIR